MVEKIKRHDQILDRQRRREDMESEEEEEDAEGSDEEEDEEDEGRRPMTAKEIAQVKKEKIKKSKPTRKGGRQTVMDIDDSEEDED